ncbi:MAG: hypothetical protein U0531_11655 [Dehalococcoidia bacterium]
MPEGRTPPGPPRNVAQGYARLADAQVAGEPFAPDFDLAVTRRLLRLRALIGRGAGGVPRQGRVDEIRRARLGGGADRQECRSCAGVGAERRRSSPPARETAAGQTHRRGAGNAAPPRMPEADVAPLFLHGVYLVNLASADPALVEAVHHLGAAST